MNHHATKPRICVSLACDEATSIFSLLQQAYQQKADLAEIRLDYLSDPQKVDLKALCRESSLPLLFTNRASFEGGRFRGGEEERIGLLLRAIEAGASFIDIEFATHVALRERIHVTASEYHCKVIVSHHDFSHTPDSATLHHLLSRMEATSADIIKIVTTATSVDDVKGLLSLYSRHYREPCAPPACELIAFCMGERGRMSRLCAMTLGAPFTYATLEAGKETAPGQLSIGEVQNFLNYW